MRYLKTYKNYQIFETKNSLLKFINESIRDEFPDMFEPDTYELELVPGFERGTIDPEDDDPWNNEKSEKELYQDFLKITKERNFKENSREVIINIKKLYEDFYMSIMNSKKYFIEFIRKELIGKYISDGLKNIVNDTYHEGIIEGENCIFDGYSAFVSFKLEGQKYDDNIMCEEYITLDKLKSTASKYNL